MGTLAYATVIASAVIFGSVAAEITAETSAAFVIDLFESYMWHPPVEMTSEPSPMDLLSQLAIED